MRHNGNIIGENKTGTAYGIKYILMRSLTLFTICLLSVLSVSACSFSFGTNAANLSGPTGGSSNSNSTPEISATPDSGSGKAPIGSPEDLVADLYKAHDAQKSPFFQTKDRALVDKYFVKSLADLIWKDAVSSNANNEVGVIAGDPLYNAQDMEIKNFSIGKGDVKGDSATVTVTFVNFDQKQSVKFLLKNVNNAWKISDIAYNNIDSLVNWFKAEPKGSTPGPSGDFVGRYRVGPTACTVKAVRQGYEIRWEKGSGSEFFGLGAEDLTFISRQKDGSENRFVFDDATFDTGKFYRVDGKVFDVRRSR